MPADQPYGKPSSQETLLTDPQYSRITRLRNGCYIARSIHTDEISDQQWDRDTEQSIVLLHALDEDGRHLIVFHAA